MKKGISRNKAYDMACARDAHIYFDALESIAIDEGFNVIFYSETWNDWTETLVVILIDDKHDACYEVTFTEYASHRCYIEAGTIQKHMDMDWHTTEDFINIVYCVIGKYLLRK